MALVSTTRGYKGRGKFILGEIGKRPFELGNATEFTEEISVERSARSNFQNASGGELDVIENVESFTFSVTVDDITPQNIAAGFLAGIEELGSLAVADEDLKAWSGTRLGFHYLPDPDEAITVAIKAIAAWAATTVYAKGDLILDGGRAYMVTVAGTSSGSEPTWPTDLSTVADNDVTWQDLGPTSLVANQDFDRTPHGIRIKDIPQNIAFPDAETMVPLVVGYTRNKQYIIQALTASQKEYEMRWEGLNAVDGGNPIHAKYFRVKLSPTSGFQRHGGDDFSTLTIEGTVLSDSTRTGAGLSTFQEMTMI